MLVSKIFKYLLPLVTALLVTSCIWDNRDDCRYPVSLKLAFTRNTQGQDLFDAEGIDNIHLFAYDYQNRLTLLQQLHRSDLEPGNRYRLMLPMGRYTLIAWAGDLQNSYRYESTDYLPNALLRLNKAPDGSVAQRPRKLFNGICIPVFAGIADKDTYQVDLCKDTKDIRITIKGTPPFLPRMEDFECTITATNGDYTFDNHTHGADRVRYIPLTRIVDGVVCCDFTVLSLRDGDDSRLSLIYRPAPPVGDAGTPTETVVYNGSLSNLLLKKPDTDLNLEERFDLKFTVADPLASTDVSLTVNGWEVINHNSGL